jgi:hypothetical protein
MKQAIKIYEDVLTNADGAAGYQKSFPEQNLGAIYVQVQPRAAVCRPLSAACGPDTCTHTPVRSGASSSAVTTSSSACSTCA